MDIYNNVVARISALGYEVTGIPSATIEYYIDLAAEKIKANINRADIPEGLRYTWGDMAVGLFFNDKKAAGQLGENFDFSAPVKSISEGDVTVTFAGASDGSNTAEARFDSLLNSMINPPQSVFARFRRLSW